MANLSHMELYIQKQPPEVFCKKGVLTDFAKFTGKHLCQSLFLNKVERPGGLKAYNFIKKETLAQVFSCEFCEISKNTFLHRTRLVAASLHRSFLLDQKVIKFLTNKRNRKTLGKTFLFPKI